jgi:superfamily I DNA/RNA helicase
MPALNTIKDNGKGKFPLVLSTIHTAKGLEWDYVFLGWDIYPASTLIADYIISEEGINSLVKKQDRIKKIEEALIAIRNADLRYNKLIEEINLLYVAITRAKRGLLFNRIEVLTELENLIRERDLKYLKSQINKRIKEFI